jgi:3-oxoacyl-[acyl-carrier protein] reductase
MSAGSEFKNKRVLVTGACGIIGGWIAKSFLEAGAHVCLTDARAHALDKLAADLELGTGSFVHTADLTDAAAIDDLARAVDERWSAPDIVINNAGIYPSGFLLDIDAAEWDRIFDINLRAPFLVTRATTRLMIRHKVKGNVVNISSGAAHKMRRTVVPYCTSKTALDRLTKGFALELAEFGIRVNALEPGFAAGSETQHLTPEHIAATTAAIPLGRASMQSDIAQALFYLCGPGAAFVTGTTLAVDGGNAIGNMAVYQQKKNPL